MQVLRHLRSHDLDEPSPYPAAARWPPSGYTLDRGPRRRRVCKPCAALLLLGRPRLQRPAPRDVHTRRPAHQRTLRSPRDQRSLFGAQVLSDTEAQLVITGAGRGSGGEAWGGIAGLRLRPALPQRGHGDPEPRGLRAAGAARLLQDPGWAAGCGLGRFSAFSCA